MTLCSCATRNGLDLKWRQTAANFRGTSKTAACKRTTDRRAFIEEGVCEIDKGAVEGSRRMALKQNVAGTSATVSLDVWLVPGPLVRNGRGLPLEFFIAASRLVSEPRGTLALRDRFAQ